MKLMIYEDKCIGCGQCKSVCIRDDIEVDEVAFETGGDCFECGHCMAICPTEAVTLKIFKGRENRICEYSNESPIDYQDLLDFLKHRRSIRWFKSKKVDKFTFDRIFEGAYYSPSAQNNQDVEFVVLDKRLDDFMRHVYSIINVEEDKFFRIRQFGDYLRDSSSYEFHPLLWEGKQLILTFSSDKTSAVVAGTHVELLAYSLGLGGFYSLFILKADEIDHDRLMEFFPEIDKSKHMYSSFVIGYPKKRFRRTLPHDDITIKFL